MNPPPPPPTTTMSHETIISPTPNKLNRVGFLSHPVHETLASAATLANLLPTGTVLTFQTLMPCFSNQGNCRTSNKYLTASLIIFCSIICFCSSFTDSFVDSEGKFCYGIATFNGFYIFNKDHDQEVLVSTTQEEEVNNNNNNVTTITSTSTSTSLDLSKFKLRLMDLYVHALVSLFVFLVFAFCDSDLQKCYFPSGGENLDVLVMNLPLAAGVFSSFLFMIFPTTRRGIGYSDMHYANSK